MRSSSRAVSALAIAVTTLAAFAFSWAAILRCSGDTDGCDPSWANDVLLGATVVAGVALALAVPVRLLRADAGGRLSTRSAIAHTLVGAVALAVLYSVLDGVLPR
jgi:hypothetical protein